MTQFDFTPPSRDPAIDILQHIWVTKNAISSWELTTPKFVEIRLSEEVEDLLRFHPRLNHQTLVTTLPNSIWGIPIKVDHSISNDPGYEISYMRVD